MSDIPLFSLDVALGTTFYQVADAAIQVARLPCMPYVNFTFNGVRFKVRKDATIEQLCKQYDTRRSDD